MPHNQSTTDMNYYSEEVHFVLESRRTWLVTGGNRGIGRALVQYLVDQAQRVFFVDRDESGFLPANVGSSGQVTYIQADLGIQAELDRVQEVVREESEGLDVLVNNGALNLGGLMSGNYVKFQQTLNVNLVAPFYLTQILIDHFVPGGNVINIASTRAFQSQADTEGYAASKGGLIALTHSMAMTLRERIRVNSISPGWIETRSGLEHEPADKVQHPSGRIGRPSDVIRLVLFLSDPANDFINGENIILDGGMSRQMVYHGDEGWSFTPS